MARANGAGTIVPIPPTTNGKKRWRVAATMADGRRVWRTAYSRRQADRILAQLVEARERELDPSRQTVEGYLRSWIDGLRRAKVQRVRDSTLTHYAGVVEHRIVPVLGPVRLSALSASRIQAWADGIDASPASVRHYHTILSLALARAVRQRLLPWNPATVTELPDRGRGVAKPLTLDEARALLATTAADRLAALWRLAVMTGMRRGELLGLTWDAVGPSWVEVRTQLQRLPPERGGDENGWALTPPKTDRRIVRVALDPDTVAALEAHRVRMGAERQPDWTYHGLVFLDPTGMPIHGEWLLDEFHRVLARAGIAKRRLHDLRHSNITLLRDLGVAEDVRMDRAGHESKGIHRRYGRASEAQDRAAADALGKALTG